VKNPALCLSISSALLCGPVNNANANSCIDPTLCAVPIEKGQRASFSGQLLSEEAALELALKADECDERTQLEVEVAVALEKIEIERCIQKAEIDRQVFAERLEAERSIRPWWAAYGAVGGFILGVVATLFAR
jgi:hypothetical protein